MSSLSQFTGGSTQVWASGITYLQGQIVLSPGSNYQQYVRVTATGSGTTDPSSDSTNYKPLGARPIKSIQRGVVTNYGNAGFNVTITVSSVDTSKSNLTVVGYNSAGVSTQVGAYLQLTNSTTITSIIQSTGAGDVTRTSWELTEYY